MPAFVKLTMVTAKDIITIRNLEKGGRGIQVLTSECSRYMEKYIPFLSGELKHIMISGIEPKAGTITINAPQARYLYHGKVMVGSPAKTVTNKDLQYTKEHNAKAGPYFDRRMWVENKEKIMKALTAVTGGTVR